MLVKSAQRCTCRIEPGNTISPFCQREVFLDMAYKGRNL